MTEKDPREIRLIYKAKSLNDDFEVVDYSKLTHYNKILPAFIVTESGEILHMVKQEVAA